MKRMLSLVMTLMLSAGLLCLSPTAFVHASERMVLNNPVLQDNGIMSWDCVYFGTYPQSSDGKGGFNVEPIKWRVLKVEGDKAYLMSDMLIDAMPFCETDGRLNCLYEESTIRCWLNGYDGGQNIKGIDYSKNNFIDKAFTKTEQEAIFVTHVVNDESMEWAQYYDDNHFDTDDKIFLITRKEVTTAQYVDYGFVTKYDEEDEEGFISEPTSRRAAYTTDYAAAGGSHGAKYAEYVVSGRCPWNLRSPGEYPMYNGFINAQGEYSDIEVDSNMLNTPGNGTRPCLYLDLTKTDVYTYAGKAYAKDEDSITGTANYVKKTSDPSFDLKLKQAGDGKITYTSSDEAVATVDQNGIVTMTGIGVVEITATSAETDKYLPGTKTVKITVKKGVSTITAADVEKTYGDDAFALGAVAPTAITYTSDNTAVCTVAEDGVVTIVAPGTAHIKMTSEGNDSFSASEASVTVTVKKQDQTVNAADVEKTYGDKPFALGASAANALTYKSSDEEVCTVAEDGTVTITGVGTAKITVTAASDKYTNSAKKVVTVTVKPGKQTISVTKASVTKTYGDAAFSLGAKAKTALTYKSSDTKVVTVSTSGKVTIKGAGKATITISAAAGNYAAATKKVTVTVKPGKVTLSSVKSSAKKQALVTWKKRAEATGYKVEYATNSKFTSAKTVTISKNGTLTTTLKSLTSGKKYYVRVRAYKKAGTSTLYGAYSAVKTVVVK